MVLEIKILLTEQQNQRTSKSEAVDINQKSCKYCGCTFSEVKIRIKKQKKENKNLLN